MEEKNEGDKNLKTLQFTFPVIFFDEINLNGRKYAKESIDIDKMNGELMHVPMFGRMDYPDEPVISLCDVSHQVNKFEFDGDGNILNANITVLNTPNGDKLRRLLDTDSLVLRTFGIGEVSEDKIVTNYKLISCCFVPKETDAFAEIRDSYEIKHKQT